MVKKDLKITIKNSQIAQTLELGKLKEKLAKKKADGSEEKGKPVKEKDTLPPKEAEPEIEALDAPRRKARTRSAFAEQKAVEEDVTPKAKPQEIHPQEMHPEMHLQETPPQEIPPQEISKKEATPEKAAEFEEEQIISEPAQKPPMQKEQERPKVQTEAKPDRLGPTGRHINDLLPKRKTPAKPVAPGTAKPASESKEASDEKKKSVKGPKVREFKDVKPARRGKFDGRSGPRFGGGDDDFRPRRRRGGKQGKSVSEEAIVRPSSLSIRLPISIKELAQDMKLKASELIQKLFLQGLIVTINDILEDETTVQLLGNEFGCQITIDTSEEERIRITDKTIREEIQQTPEENLILRAPVVAFMGHVDHGKTSLIDYIRKSDIAAGEAGAITQHIGAFRCKTAIGDITILDTPGHEAFSAMRVRGAEVTDIVVLVVAGDEGMRAQTIEAMQHAKAAGVTIVVAANKCDKDGYDYEKILRQLSDHELLAESWGGQTIVVKCSATTGEGVEELLEMLALQAEVLELKADTSARARGIVLESEMHKGLGMVANVIILNGTLHQGDALVFEESFGRIKTMFDEHGRQMTDAGPSTPLEITGLSGLPEAGEEFIVVPTEQEARKIAEARYQGKRTAFLQQRRPAGLESLLQEKQGVEKKVLTIVLRADVQGSLEALKSAIEGIESDKAQSEVIFAGVGEISESDVQLAAASNAVIVGFHVQVESHAEPLVKQHGIKVKLHDIIYHAIDDVKALLTDMLDKISFEVEKGKAEVKQVFKSSQFGNIAGCMIIEGTIHRNNQVRVSREGEIVWTGSMSAIRRGKEDVREIQKGFECGITLSGFNQIQEGDIIEAYEISYKAQEL